MNSHTHQFLSTAKKLLPFALFLLGMWYFCFRIIGFDLEFIPGDLGDSRFNNYVLEHGYQYLIGDVQSFWSADFMFPFQNTIAISDNLLGTLAFYSAFRLFGFEMETSFQLWWLTMNVLNFWITYLIVKRWTHSAIWAALIAFVFAFSVLNLFHVSHLQMAPRFMIPVVFYAATKLIDSGSKKYLGWLILGVVLQFYCAIYTGFFLFYFVIGFMLVYTIIQKRYRFLKELFSKAQWIWSAAFTILGIASLLVLMVPYMRISNELGLRLFDEVKWNLPTWKGYLFPHNSSIWSFLHEPMKSGESWWLQSVFSGILPFIVFISIPFLWLKWKIRKIKVDRFLLALSIVVFGIALLFIRLENGLTLYALIFKFPGMNSMRAMNRFMFVELFLLLILAYHLLKNLPKWTFLLILPLIFADNAFDASKAPRSEKSEWISRKEHLLKEVNRLREDDHVAFAYVNSKEDAYKVNLDAMMVSQQTDLATINGYSATCPNDFGLFFNEASGEGLQLWIDANNIDSSTVLIIGK